MHDNMCGLSNFLCPSNVLLPLLAVLLGSTLAQDSCRISTSRLYECGDQDGNATILQSYVSSNCDYLFTVQWTPSLQVGYFVNRAELVDEDDEITSFPFTLLSYEYTQAGVYDIRLTIQGYLNITDPNNATALDTEWLIKQERGDNFLQITIDDDGTCEDTTVDSSSGAQSPSMVAVGYSTLAASALAWFCSL
eukprot:scaffold2702_cov168-Amphora_coffeaeformis.AAC.9